MTRARPRRFWRFIPLVHHPQPWTPPFRDHLCRIGWKDLTPFARGLRQSVWGLRQARGLVVMDRPPAGPPPPGWGQPYGPVATAREPGYNDWTFFWMARRCYCVSNASGRPSGFVCARPGPVETLTTTCNVSHDGTGRTVRGTTQFSLPDSRDASCRHPGSLK